jgi:uncharacterized protein YbaR (Trm112 family)
MSEDGNSEDSEASGKAYETFNQEKNPTRSNQDRRSVDVLEEKRVDSKLLDECLVLSDYERELLRLCYVEHKGPTEIGKLYGKDKSTIVPQRDRAYEKYVNWVQAEDQDASEHEAEEEQAITQDPEVRKALQAVHDMEARRDRAKALWEARELEKQAREEALEYEAILEPRKIAAYLAEVMAKSNLAADRALANQYLWLVRKKKLSPEDACVEAVKSFGKSYDEWRAPFVNYSEFEYEPTLKEYVQRVFWRWIWSNGTLDCRCPECRKRLTISKDEKGELTRMACSSEHSTKSLGHYLSHYCPVCEQVDPDQILMVYLPMMRVFYCRSCGTRIKAEPRLIVTQD